MSLSPSLLLLLLLFGVVVVVVQASKDSDYYFPGFTNPLTVDRMYWKDSINVLQDLDQFEYLYVKYEGCVWSKYGSRYGSGQNYDEQGYDQEDAYIPNGCGGWGGEYFWYMGRTQCFKANVAYTLYGVLKGEQPKAKHGSYCHKDSYINSFFTTFGVESFIGPLGLGSTYAINSYCTAVDSGNGENGNFDDVIWDDDYLSDYEGFQFHNWTAYTSYGTGCSADGTSFVSDQYQGAFCNGHEYQQTLDYLEAFNAAIREYDCQVIYSASDYNNNNNNNNNKGRELEEGGQEDEYDFDQMNPLDILSFSKSCSLRQYPKDCPDPFGKKKHWGKEVDRALAYKTGNERDVGTRAMKIVSYVNLVLGTCLVGAAIWVRRRQQQRSSQSTVFVQKQQQQRKRKNKKVKDITTSSEHDHNNDNNHHHRNNYNISLPEMKVIDREETEVADIITMAPTTTTNSNGSAETSKATDDAALPNDDDDDNNNNNHHHHHYLDVEQPPATAAFQPQAEVTSTQQQQQQSSSSSSSSEMMKKNYDHNDMDPTEIETTANVNVVGTTAPASAVNAAVPILPQQQQQPTIPVVMEPGAAAAASQPQQQPPPPSAAAEHEAAVRRRRSLRRALSPSRLFGGRRRNSKSNQK